MPSPFPGMDPYLESPDWFPDLHDGMIIQYQRGTSSPSAQVVLCPVPPARLARSGTSGPVEPDVDVLRSGGAKPRRRRRDADAGGVAVAEPVTSGPVVVSVGRIMGDPEHEPFLEIHRRQGPDDVVVAIVEILSPSNKTPGDHGRNVYVAKQQETLLSQVHLIEIDLLRAGTHATAVPLDLALAEAGSFDYHVCVHRSDHFTDFFVYPIKLESKLPVIAVPLLPGDPDVPLDLQAVFDRAYDAGPYDSAVRYDMATVEPPLRPDQEQWVKARLAAEHV